MTYFDPQTYNWEELVDDEKIFMNGYNYCIKEVKTAFSNLMVDSEYSEGTPTLDKVIEEIQRKLRDDVVEWIKRHRVQMTAELMDGNEKYMEK